MSYLQSPEPDNISDAPVSWVYYLPKEGLIEELAKRGVAGTGTFAELRQQLLQILRTENPTLFAPLGATATI